MIIPIYHHRRLVRRYREWDDAEPLPATKPAICWYTWTPVPDAIEDDRADLLHTTISGGEIPSYLVAAPDAEFVEKKGKWFVRNRHDKAMDVETVKFRAVQRTHGMYSLPADDPLWSMPERWAVPGAAPAVEPAPVVAPVVAEPVAVEAPVVVVAAGLAVQQGFGFGDPDWLQEARKPGRRKAVRS